MPITSARTWRQEQKFEWLAFDARLPRHTQVAYSHCAYSSSFDPVAWDSCLRYFVGYSALGKGKAECGITEPYQL